MRIVPTTSTSLIGHVEPHGPSRAALAHDLGHHLSGRSLRASIADDDRGALSPETLRNRPADRSAAPVTSATRPANRRPSFHVRSTQTSRRLARSVSNGSPEPQPGAIGIKADTP
jgi:hypothetical protein